MKKAHIALGALCMMGAPLFAPIKKTDGATPAETPTALIKSELSAETAKPLQKRFVDPMKILPNAKPWVEGMQQLESDLRGRAQQIEEMMKTYGVKEQELRNSANLITPTVKEAKAKELLRLQNNIEIEKQAFEQHRMQRMQELEAKIGNQVCAAAKKYAEANGIDEIAAAGFIYCKPSLDVSNEVLALLNQTYEEEMAKKSAIAAPSKPSVQVANASADKSATTPTKAPVKVAHAPAVKPAVSADAASTVAAPAA